MALAAALQNRSVLLQTWTEEVVDKVVRYGDNLYMTSLKSGVIPDENTLLVSYLPVVEKSLDGRAWVIKYGQFFQGRTERCFSPDFPYQSLEDSIVNAFCLSDELFVILEGYTMYVSKSCNYIWLFDSHARDLNGMPSETGAAVLICFSDLAEIVDHLRILATKLHTKCYETVCLHLSSIDCDGIRPNWKRNENIPILQQTSVGQGSPCTTSPGTPTETWGIEGKVLGGACAPASANHCTMKHDNAIELLQSRKLNSKSEFKGRSALKQSIILDHNRVGLSK